MELSVVLGRITAKSMAWNDANTMIRTQYTLKIEMNAKGVQSGTITIDAADWLVSHQVKLLGVDFSTPDLTAHKRPAGFTWPVHQILLSQGVLVAEHLTNLRSLANQRVEAMFLALPIAGSDGTPARVLARPLVAT